MSCTPNRLNRFLIAAVVGAVSATSFATADSIALKGSVRLDPDRKSVRLEDVARLDGSYAESLGEKVVCAWDGIGLTTVSFSDVRQVLSDSQVNWGVLSLSGTECVVRPRAAVVADEQKPQADGDDRTEVDRPMFASDFFREPTLRGEIARLFVHRLFREPAADIRMTFREQDTEAITRRTDQYQFEVTPAATANSSRIPLNIRVFEHGRLVDSFRLNVSVLIRMEVVIVDRALGRDDVLTSDVLHAEVRFMEPHPDPPIRAVKDVLGLEAQGRLVAGQVLRSDDVARPIAVRRRSRVAVTAIVNSFAIRMNGRAREDGRIGDVIRVTREPDGFEMSARIEPNGELVLIDSR